MAPRISLHCWALIIYATCVSTLNTTSNSSSPDCSTFTTCDSCANASTWLGSHCRWCPLKGDLQCHDEGSIFNKCDSDQQITDPLECPDAPGRLPRTNVTTALYNDMVRRVKETYAAYCSPDLIQSWTCKWCEPTLENVTVYGVASNSSLNTQAYVVTVDNPGPKRVVASFKGTQMSSLVNWINNVKFFSTPVPWLPDGAEAHRGFLADWTSLSDVILPAVLKAKSDCPSCEVHCIGHSLGAAEATLLATLLKASYGIEPKLYTFGSPRVGNANFASWFRENIDVGIDSSYRMVHRDDVIPHLPPADLGFQHVAREIWDTDGKGCGDGACMLCDNSGEDHKCSWSVATTSFSTNDHFGYMGLIEGC